ncbi:MAG: hypothetical protein QM601_02540 [Pseudoxanthomonas sp.]
MPARALRALTAAAVLVLSPSAAAQDAAGENRDAAAAADPAVTTLDTVQALPPEDQVETLDLDRFKNPVQVEPNRFGQAYDTGISPQDMALKYGGYVNYGLNRGLYETWKGLKKVTGMRPYERSASARPPPLSAEQMQRAARACGEDGQACPAPAADD